MPVRDGILHPLLLIMKETAHVTFLADTDPAIRERIIAHLRSLTPEEKLSRMSRMCAFGRLWMIEGIRAQRPSISDAELRTELAMRLWGAAPHDLVRQVRPAEPEGEV